MAHLLTRALLPCRDRRSDSNLMAESQRQSNTAEHKVPLQDGSWQLKCQSVGIGVCEEQQLAFTQMAIGEFEQRRTAVSSS